jgi:UDP-glucose 4-epimerase
MWLVTGGAGYIGAHVVRHLQRSGRAVAVIDNLSTGLRSKVADDVPFVQGSVADRALLKATFANYPITGVLHLAAKKAVGESVERPLWYWEENVGSLQVLLEEMVAAGIAQFVYSSSAAVYGQPDSTDLITELSDCRPINPYGATKLAGEWMTSATADRHGWSAMSLRYFNVAGAGADDLCDPGVFNLIPIVFRALDNGEQPKIYGDDYPTPDGTCIRDYVHVDDLADAHVQACAYVESHPNTGNQILNIGTGRGSSVNEVLAVVTSTAGVDATGEAIARRAGDPAQLVAAVDKAAQVLNWSSSRDLTDMVASAWQAWRQRDGANQ